VIKDLPKRRRTRLETFDPVERGLADEMGALERTGIKVQLSAVLRTPEDLRNPSPLLLDLTEDAVLLQDEGHGADPEA